MRPVHPLPACVDTFLADTETFGYDELDRPTLLKNYTAELRRDYNKSGNTVSETVKVDGHDRTLTREFDLRGDPTALTYPGGRQLAFTRDDLGRLDLIRSGATTIADYGYAGAARLLEKKVSDIAPLVSSYTYDSEWMPHGVTRAVGPNQLVNQTFGWTARHEIDRESNLLRRQVGSRFDYDAAGRLDHAGFGVPEGRNLNQGLRVLDYGHDQVRNRTSLSERVGGPYAKSIGLTEVGIGNRYAKYDGQPLSYHADGSTKTDQAGRALEYDHAGRLTRVERNGEVVTYGYDVLGRKVKRTDADGTTYFWYDGWQLIEETDATGAVIREIVNGPNVDEPLQYKVNGITYRPIQDRMGSVTAIVNEVGKLVEAFEYGPYGSFRAHRAEHLEQVRLESMRLVLRFTGEVGQDAIDALQLTPNLPGTWTASTDGRELSFLPDDGDDANHDPDWLPLNYTIEVPSSTRTAFAIELHEGRLTSFNASDLNDRFLGDWRTPEVERVAQDPDGKLHVVFSEPIADLNLATAFLLTEAANSYPIPFTVARSASNLVAEITPSEPLTVEADYRLELIADKVEDLASNRATTRAWTFTCNENPHRIWDTEQNTVSASLFGNRLFFQGRELDPVTGLYDFRNRWYDPEVGRFLTPDPLGYPDGPNQYAAFLANPSNLDDPFGTDSLREFTLDAAEARLDAGGAWNGTVGYGTLFGYSLLNTVTVGFANRHDEKWEMAEAGLISNGEYWLNGVGVSAVRSGAVFGVAVSTGGAGAGFAQGYGLSTAASFSFGGASAGIGGVFASDLIDVNVLHERTGYSSPGTYATAAVLGGVGGYGIGRWGGVPSRSVAKGINGENQVAEQINLPRNAGTGRERFAIPGQKTPTGRQAFTYPDFRPSQSVPSKGAIVDAKNVSVLDYNSGNIHALRQAAAASGVRLELHARAATAFSPRTVIAPSMQPFLGSGAGQITLCYSIDPFAGARPPVMACPQGAREAR